MSVRDTDLLAVVLGRLDLIKDRDCEVRARDARVAVCVEQRNLPTDPVVAGALAGRPGSVRPGRADEQPVEILRRALDEHHTSGLAFQRLGAVLLAEVTLDEPRMSLRRPQ